MCVMHVVFVTIDFEADRRDRYACILEYENKAILRVAMPRLWRLAVSHAANGEE